MLPMNSFMAILPLIISLLSLMSLIMFWMMMMLKSKNFKMKKVKMSTINKYMTLFTSFDPKSSIPFFFEEMNWLIPLVFLSTTFLMYWFKPSRAMSHSNTLIIYFSNQFEIALKNKKDSSKLNFISIFIFIILSNLSGLIPNSFTLTSHMTTNLFISVPMWMSFIIFGWINFPTKMFVHLVPNGTPMPLMSFMVLIEIISSSIRPFTLSVRLMANMVSGHLLLTLLGNTMMNLYMILMFMMMMIQTMLYMLEIGVCIIQSYVFCMLMTLYSDESDFLKD